MKGLLKDSQVYLISFFGSAVMKARVLLTE